MGFNKQDRNIAGNIKKDLKDRNSIEKTHKSINTKLVVIGIILTVGMSVIGFMVKGS